MSTTTLTSLFSLKLEMSKKHSSVQELQDVYRCNNVENTGTGYRILFAERVCSGDPFKNINWKAFARTGDLMINEKCRDAVTDLYIILDSRDIQRIGTVLKNPLEMGTVAAASLASFFLKRRDSVSLTIYDEKLSFLPLIPVTSSTSRSFHHLQV